MKHNKLKWMMMPALLLVFTITAFAQAGRPLTLKEAIDLSIRNSKELKNSQAKIEEATASLREAVERRLPEASASASYLRLNSPHVKLNTKPDSTANNGGGSSSFGSPSSALYGILNVSLPIYSGSRIKYGIESSKYLAEAAKLDADNQREAVIYNVIDAYNNLFKARSAVDLVNESLNGARQRVKDFTNLEANGILARNDLLKAQLQESNTELSLLDAENNWKLANINMDLMLGLPDSTTLTIVDSALLSNNEVKVVEDYVQQGLQTRKDVASLALRKKAAETGVKVAQGGMYPSIALTGGYIAADVPNVITVTNAVNIGVGVQYSLSSLWKKSGVDEARARVKELTANEEMLSDAVRLQVNKAYQNYLSSVKKIDVYNTAVAQADENYKIVNNKFTNQLATTTDLLDADVARLQARLNASFSRTDATVAYYKLLQTAGQLNTQTK